MTEWPFIESLKFLINEKQMCFLGFLLFFVPKYTKIKARVSSPLLSSQPDPCLTVYLTGFYFLPKPKSIFLYLSEELDIPLDSAINQVDSIRFDYRLADKDVRERRKGFDNGQNPKQGQGQRQEKACHSFFSSWSSGTLFSCISLVVGYWVFFIV